MADDGQDKEQKTEDPTPKRLEEALKKGNIPFSREVSSFLLFFVLTLTVVWLAPGILIHAKLFLTPFITAPDDIPISETLDRDRLAHVMFGALAIIALPLVGAMVAAVAASVLQNGFIISIEPLEPKLERISPMTGLKRMFSMRSVVELIKSLLKIAVVGAIAFLSVYPDLPHIGQLPNSTTEAMLLFMAKLTARVTIGVTIALFFIALLDFLYQRYEYIKSLRMSRQELKDEYKQSEGDPMVKQRLRQLRMERARKRMMADVPKADVVITNPTHFSVALQYEMDKMKAPVVIAKGQDLVALKIREVAKEHNVPIVENPPLARALYASAEIDEEIPVVHYEAVAKVISYVYQLKGKKPRAKAAR